MEIDVVEGRIEERKDEAIVVNLFEGVKKPGGATGSVDKALGNLISETIAMGDFKGKFKEVLLLRTHKIPSPRVLVVGLGEKTTFNLDRIREVSGKAAKHLRDLGLKSFSTIIHGAGIANIPVREAAEAVVEGTLLATYRFEGYKTDKGDDEKKKLDKMTIVEYDKKKIGVIQEAVRTATIVAESTFLARDLVNKPSNDKTPEKLAKLAEKVAEDCGLSCTILSEVDMEKLGMGALLGVAKGSSSPPRLIVLEHKGEGGKPIIIVGKGITFDSGGINLKPSQGLFPLLRMKDDMGGAATVIATLQAVAKLKLRRRVIGIAPCAENMPSGEAQKPGDVVRCYSGKTVEVANTDAEGRLILADAISYATKYGPEAIIDVATLTGACVIALGRKISGLMSNDDRLAQKLEESSKVVGENIWRLPLLEEYGEQLKSDVADIKNVGSRFGGAITGAIFLKNFVGNTPWAHLDIAGTVWTDGEKDSLNKEYVPKGATGVGVRLLTHLIRNWD
ncbi:MAG: leucyl aminopeptidase [Methanobacteriota archaeon]|nr:MAG: leucyl aminopeptidase [Euryarchaeota archaeon]